MLHGCVKKRRRLIFVGLPAPQQFLASSVHTHVQKMVRRVKAGTHYPFVRTGPSRRPVSYGWSGRWNGPYKRLVAYRPYKTLADYYLLAVWSRHRRQCNLRNSYRTWQTSVFICPTSSFRPQIRAHLLGISQLVVAILRRCRPIQATRDRSSITRDRSSIRYSNRSSTRLPESSTRRCACSGFSATSSTWWCCRAAECRRRWTPRRWNGPLTSDWSRWPSPTLSTASAPSWELSRADNRPRSGEMNLSVCTFNCTVLTCRTPSCTPAAGWPSSWPLDDMPRFVDRSRPVHHYYCRHHLISQHQGEREGEREFICQVK